MSRLGPLFAFFIALGLMTSRPATTRADGAMPAPRSAGGCPNDADCDGISNAIEAAVGGAGIDPAGGAFVLSATQDPAGIHVTLGGPGLAGQAIVDLPPGTTAGAEAITLEFGAAAGSGDIYAVVRKGNLPPGGSKSIAMPAGMPILVIVDAPDATRSSLSSAPASSRFAVPPCPCPASTSLNILGAPTPYTVTNQGGTIHVYGLLNTAIGTTSATMPVPGSTAGSHVALALLVIVTGALAVCRRGPRSASSPA